MGTRQRWIVVVDSAIRRRIYDRDGEMALRCAIELHLHAVTIRLIAGELTTEQHREFAKRAPLGMKSEARARGLLPGRAFCAGGGR